MPEQIDGELNQNPEEENPKKKEAEENIQHIRVDLDEETAQGCYSNLAICSISPDEFTFDFVYLQPNIPKGKIRSRILVTPKNAKRFLSMLESKIHEYENKYGPITEDKNFPGMRLSFN